MVICPISFGSDCDKGVASLAEGKGQQDLGQGGASLNLTYIFMEDSLWQTMYPMIKTSESWAGETT